MSTNLDFKKIVLFLIVLTEIVLGFRFLTDFYQQKIVYKLPAADKIAVINKENLIFPKDTEFKHYYELKPNIKESDAPAWLGYKVEYSYNADGLNDSSDYEVEKEKDVFRIITLGDSFTFGHFVNTKENWPEQLEILLNESTKIPCGIKKFEVINLGVHSFDIPYLVKRYKDIGAKYKPDLIIWFESGAGFIRLNELMEPIIDECELDESNNSGEKERAHYCYSKATKEINDKYSYEDISQLITSYLDNFFSSLDQEKVLFFTFEESNLERNYINTLKQWEERYPDVNFSSTVPNIYELAQVLPDGHPNPEGHKNIAFSIYNYLDKYLTNYCE